MTVEIRICTDYLTGLTSRVGQLANDLRGQPAELGSWKLDGAPKTLSAFRSLTNDWSDKREELVDHLTEFQGSLDATLESFTTQDEGMSHELRES